MCEPISAGIASGASSVMGGIGSHQSAQAQADFTNEQSRRQYDYATGQQVLKKVHNPTSLGVRTNGPYTIDRVHVNGTLTIRLRPGVTERINIRRVVPYR